jgi:hypothetical protein
MILAFVLLSLPVIRTLRSRGRRAAEGADKETISTAID